MLDPTLILNAIVASLQSNTQLIAQLGGVTDEYGNATIVGHQFLGGADNSLARAVGNMRAPSLLLAYESLLGGNFDGATTYKHRIRLYIRPKNATVGLVAGEPGVSPLTLWTIAMKAPITVPAPASSIRVTDFLNGSLVQMEPPTLIFQQDEELNDMFVGTMVFPEYNDVDD